MGRLLRRGLRARPSPNIYPIAAPKRSFAIALNQASIVRGTESVRKPGGSFMTCSPASLGKALLEKSEEEVIKTHLTDLDQVLGHGFADRVVEAKVDRWKNTSPYCFPGGAKTQSTLTRRRLSCIAQQLGARSLQQQSLVHHSSCWMAGDGCVSLCPSYSPIGLWNLSAGPAGNALQNPLPRGVAGLVRAASLPQGMSFKGVGGGCHLTGPRSCIAPPYTPSSLACQVVQRHAEARLPEVSGLWNHLAGTGAMGQCIATHPRPRGLHTACIRSSVALEERRGARKMQPESCKLAPTCDQILARDVQEWATVRSQWSTTAAELLAAGPVGVSKLPLTGL